MRYPVVLAALLALFAGCEKNRLGVTDVSSDVPFLYDASVLPDSVYLDGITPAAGNYRISATVMVRTALRGDAAEVNASVQRMSSSEAVVRIRLHDDGVAPDVSAGDSVFSGTIEFTIPRSAAGQYRVLFSSVSGNDLESNIVDKRLLVNRKNSPPVLLSATAPDTVDVPASGFITVRFTATAADSDGLADIRQVYFTRISPVDPANTKFFMKDDGNLSPPDSIGGIPLRSGDTVAGDGTFSFLVPVTPGTTRRTNVFAFHAVDNFGDTSNVLQRSLTIR